MDKKEIRKYTERRLNWDIIISIPENAGPFGDLEAIYLFPTVREKLKKTNKPISKKVSWGFAEKTYVFGESEKMKNNSRYLNKFITMCYKNGPILEIFGMSDEDL